MEQFVQNLADGLGETKARIYTALKRLSLVEVVEQPHKHWESTQKGARYLKETHKEKLVALIKEQLEAMDDPYLGPPPVIQRKTCRNCHRTMFKHDFGVSEKNADGLTKWCLDCLMEYNESQHYGAF
ncbi:hypothetical protein [Motiliproteus sp. SC1-56]|uniref:hypothetical protein n=1 Tax=Motiliproteus sp. SC1-56 TaxID=2799565 RepID=UPI001A8FBCBA|nr:hypothetical protein [Motiliproteus sp. SC1-56]